MIRRIKDEDFVFIEKWWEHFKFPRIPNKNLPDGYLAFDEGVAVAAAWCYYAPEQKMGMVAWVIMNPETDYNMRTRCFTHLLTRIEVDAKEKGVDTLLTPTNNGSLIKRFESNGWTTYDVDVVHLVKKL